MATAGPHVVTAEAATTLATWAMKVAILIDRAQASWAAQLVPTWMARELRQTSQPPSRSVTVWATTTEVNKGSAWWFRPLLRSMQPRGSGVDVANAGSDPQPFVGIFNFAQLGLFVVGGNESHEPRDLVVNFRTAIHRLWPEPTSFSWPLSPMLGERDLEMLADNAGGFFRES